MRISVCMATHNGARYIGEQINSILTQLGTADEVIISDDQSTDGLPKILKSYPDSRIKLLPTRRFSNPSRNFEYALGKCIGDRIFISDQDDVWLPEKVRVQNAALDRADLVMSDCRLTDEDLNVTIPSFFQFNRSGRGLFRNLIRNSYMGCCMAFRRCVLEKSLPFPETIPMYDQWIGLVAEKYFRVEFMPQVLVDHRVHLKNFSSTGNRSRHSFLKKLDFRYQLMKSLLFC